MLLWNLLNLGRFPEAQQALRSEVQEVLGPAAHFTSRWEGTQRAGAESPIGPGALGPRV